MTPSTRPQLLVAHPGHELLLYGWIRRTRPRVQVLTDGSGPARLAATADLVRAAGARPGAIFARMSDREAYSMLLERNLPLLLSLVTDLAAEIESEQTTMIVCDAVEGYNPVHDLCRLIAGAAIRLSGRDIPQLEYAVVEAPHSFEGAAGEVIRIDLDDAEHAAKIDAARGQATAIPDVDELFSRHGVDAYRREVLRSVGDWTDLGDDPKPLYERFGEDRVAAHRYARVIRKTEHMIPLRDALCAEVEKRACAF